jgi:hypothetical protein
MRMVIVSGFYQVNMERPLRIILLFLCILGILAAGCTGPTPDPLVGHWGGMIGMIYTSLDANQNGTAIWSAQSPLVGKIETPVKWQKNENGTYTLFTETPGILIISGDTMIFGNSKDNITLTRGLTYTPPSSSMYAVTTTQPPQIAPQSVATQSQDEKMDMAFVSYLNDNQIVDRMSALMQSNKGAYYIDQGFNAEPKNEAVTLTGLITKAPSPGSESMKSYRSAMLNALSLMDGTTAGFSRYTDAMNGVITTGKAALDQYSVTSTSSVISGSKSITLSGTGDDVREFTLYGDGMRIFVMSYSGNHNFAIWVKDAQGDKIDLIANEIGSYSGKKSERMGPGTYYLDVTASGPWTVTITSA